jgi:uncharacterized protein (DUF885 family)
MIKKIALSMAALASITLVAQQAPQEKALHNIARDYYQQVLQLNPLQATAQGHKQYNHLLLDNLSDAHLAKETALCKATLSKLKNIKPEALSPEQQTVYQVLMYELNDRQKSADLHFEVMPFNQFYGLHLEMPVLGSGESSQPFATEKDYQNWLKRIDGFCQWLKTAEMRLKQGVAQQKVLPKALVEKMIPQFLAPEIMSLDMEKNIFYKPILNYPKNLAHKDKFAKAYQASISQKLIPAYQSMANYLKTDYLKAARSSSGLHGIPQGDKIYQYCVANATTTALSPEEINQIGLKEVARIKAEMLKVQQQLGFNGTLPQFLEHLKTEPKAMPYRSASEVIGAFNGILSQIQPQLDKMFHQKPKTGFEVKATEKFRELTSSAEYQAGSPDGSRKGVFYIPLPEPEKFNLTTGMESLFLHEAIPGHHYQVSLQQENKSLPDFMRFSGFNAYAEGWALYCESLGYEMGMYQNPYQKMGALSDEMMRAVRLVIDTGLHTGRLSREQAIDYFLDHVSYSREAGVAEIERYMAWPGQALGYKIGSLKIRELRQRHEQQLGAKFNLADFHWQVLNMGGMPLDVLEQKLKHWADGVAKP